MAFLFAILIFVSCAVQGAASLSFVWGSLTREIAGFSLASGMIAALVAWNQIRSRIPAVRFTLRGACSFAILLLVTARYFFWIYFPDQKEWKTFEIIENRLPLFLSGVAGLVEGQKFWPENPVLMTERLHDFGTTLFAALGVKAAIPLTSLLPVMTLSAAVMSGILLIAWAGEISAAVFLFWSGAAGLLIFLAGQNSSFQVYLSQKTAFAGALPLMVFISNPGFWFALPAGLWLMISSREKLKGGGVVPAPLSGWECFLWGGLALFHLHSFLMITLFLFFQALGARRLRWFGEAFLRMSLWAAPWILLITGFLSDRSVLLEIHRKNMHFEGGAGVAVFKKYGTVFPWLAAVLAAAIFQKRRQDLVAYVFPAAAGFLFLVFFDPGPWLESGITSLVWCYLVLAFPLKEAVYDKASPGFRMVLLAALCLPGMVLHYQTYNGYLRNKKPVVSMEQNLEVCGALEKLPRKYRFATAMVPYHPAALCGFPVVSAFNESYFADRSPEKENAERLRRLLSASPKWRELAEALNVRFIFWGREEKRDFPESGAVWEKVAKKAADGSWGTVYDIGTPGSVVPVPDPGYGIRASFFNNKECRAEPLAVKSFRNLDFKWKESEQDVLSTSFGILFEGRLRIPETGKVTFYLASDDGSVLEIDGKIVVDNGGDHGLRIKFGTAVLEKGWHPFRVIYHNDWGMAFLRLWWKPENGEEGLIPDSSLMPPMPEKEGD